MALPSSGIITMAQVAAELGVSATGLSLGDSRVRSLAGVPSGPISMSDLHGKSSATIVTRGYAEFYYLDLNYEETYYMWAYGWNSGPWEGLFYNDAGPWRPVIGSISNTNTPYGTLQALVVEATRVNNPNRPATGQVYAVFATPVSGQVVVTINGQRCVLSGKISNQRGVPADRHFTNSTKYPLSVVADPASWTVSWG